MTKSAPSKQGVGAREAGRQLSVSHTYLLRLARENRIPRYGDGSFDVAAVRAALAAQTDPSQVRGPEPLRWSQGGNRAGNPVTSDHRSTKPARAAAPSLWDVAIEAAGHATDPFEKGVTVAVVMLAHQVGAAMAVLAAAEGVPLPAAFALKDAATVGFLELGEDLLRQLPCFSGVPAGADLPIRYRPEAFDRVDWDVVARSRGETADVPAWTAAARERRQQVAA